MTANAQPSQAQEEFKKEAWRLMDSFLVEATDQHGNPCSLKQLNYDRRLFIDGITDAAVALAEKVAGRRQDILSRKRTTTTIQPNQIMEFDKALDRALSRNVKHYVYLPDELDIPAAKAAIRAAALLMAEKMMEEREQND